MTRLISLAFVAIAAVVAFGPAHLDRSGAQEPAEREQMAPPLEPLTPYRAEPRPGALRPDVLPPPAPPKPGIDREPPELPSAKPIAAPPGGVRTSSQAPAAPPTPDPRTIDWGGEIGGAGLTTAGSVQYISSGVIQYNSSSPGAVSIVSIAFTPGFTYRFSDSGGVFAGVGCVAVDFQTVDCPAPAAVLIESYLSNANDTYYQDGLDNIDALNVYGLDGGDSIVIGGLGVALNGPSYVQGDAGTDYASFADGGTASAQTYGVTSLAISRSLAGVMSYDSATTERLQLNAGTGTDLVQVDSTPAGVATDIFPGVGEANQVNVGAGNLDAVGGFVGVYGYAADVVIVNDSGPVYGDAYAITSTDINRFLFGGVYYAGVGAVQLYGQPSGNAYGVTSTGPLTSIFAGSGNDTFDVGMNMDNILTTLTVHAAGGMDELRVDDTGNPISDSWSISLAAASRLFSGGVAFNNGVLDLESFVLNAQQVGSTIFVDSTASPTRVNGLGGGDVFVVGGGFMDNLLALATIDGGPGSDVVRAYDSFNGFDDSYVVTSNIVDRNSTLGLAYTNAELVTLEAGTGGDQIAVSDTSSAAVYALFGNSGVDSFRVGPDLGLIGGQVSINGENGSDMLLLDDSSSAAFPIYELRNPGFFERLGTPPITYASVEGLQLNGTAQTDAVRLLGTEATVPVQVFLGGGDDFAQVFATGLAVVGAATLNGGANNDTLLLYTGGLGSFFSPPSTIFTPGRHNVSYFEFETTATPATGADSDGDSCPDVFEIGVDENLGGRRNPSYFWDWFDVADPAPPPAPDRAIDLSDTLEVLSKFGLLPGDLGYSPVHDRVAGPSGIVWRTEAASGTNLGIDLGDAIVSLHSFGHRCV